MWLCRTVQILFLYVLCGQHFGCQQSHQWTLPSVCDKLPSTKSKPRKTFAFLFAENKQGKKASDSTSRAHFGWKEAHFSSMDFMRQTAIVCHVQAENSSLYNEVMTNGKEVHFLIQEAHYFVTSGSLTESWSVQQVILLFPSAVPREASLRSGALRTADSATQLVTVLNSD